jgi:hypothetical protein
MQDLLPRNDNLGQIVNQNTGGTGDQSCWDLISPTNGGKTAFVLEDLGWAGDPTVNNGAVGVSKENATTKSRTVFWSFPYEHLSVKYRARAALDTLEWLMDGAVKGNVVQLQGPNGLKPVPDALVIVSEILGIAPATTRRDLAAARTDSAGEFYIGGLRSGIAYQVRVVANGYTGAMEHSNIIVRGGLITNDNGTQFFLIGDPSKCVINGVVTQSGVPVAGASVIAAPLGGSAGTTTVTDAQGRFEMANLAVGPYAVTATHPVTAAVVSATTESLTAGQTRRVDLAFGSGGAVAGSLRGQVRGDASPIPGATVAIYAGGASVATLTADQNGQFAINNLPAGTYTVEASAPGFINKSTSVVYTPQAGAVVTLDLLPIGGSGVARVYARVYDNGTNQPFGNALVEVLVGDTVITWKRSAATFQTGVYTYNVDFQLAPGSYRLRVSANGRRTLERALNLAPGETQADVELRVEPLYTFAPGVYMFSLPGQYGGLDFSTALGLSPAYLAGASTADSRLAGYTPGAGYTMYAGPGSLPITAGAGYWLRLDRVAGLQAEGTPVDATVPFPRALAPEWNLVGNPFPFAVDLFDCAVTTVGLAPMTWAQAQQAGIVGGVAYTWAGNQYQPATTLQPYMGYWISASRACTLLISNRSAVRQGGVAPMARSAALAGAWQVNLSVRAGDGRDSFCAFGVSAEGLDGFSNTADLRKAPAPMGAYVSLAFPHRDWGANGGDFATDIQAPGAGEKRWRLRVDSNVTDGDVLITWPELSTQLPEGYQAVLTDATTGRACFMNTSAGFSYRPGAEGASREFVVTVSPRSGAPLIWGAMAQGGRGRAMSQVVFSVAQPADVTVAIRSQTGRTVRTLTVRAEAAGEQTVLWDQRCDDGRIAPRGVYLVDVLATDDTGRRAHAAAVLPLLALR